MQEARDDVYCFLVARRAVARAALHLGIREMSLEALDSVGEILLAYLERFGRALSHSVESSGRSSAHANALDALRAAELCTSSAADTTNTAGGTAASASAASLMIQDAGGTVDGGGDEGQSSMSALQQQQRHQQQQQQHPQDVSWKGLASFCFGPEWHRAELADPQQLQAISGGMMLGASGGTGGDIGGGGGGAGGKIGPSSSMLHSDAGTGDVSSGGAGGLASVSGQGAMALSGGWNAPFPDELIPFPSTTMTRGTASRRPFLNRRGHRSPPHSLYALQEQKQQPLPAERTRDENHADEAQVEEHLQRMPDSVFFQEWGSLKTKSEKDAVPSALKRKASETADNNNEETAQNEEDRPRKKVRLMDDKSNPENQTGAAGLASASLPQTGMDGINYDYDYDDDETSQHYLKNGATADYVPRYYPAFPKPSDSMGRTVLVDLDGIDNNDANTSSRDKDSSNLDRKLNTRNDNTNNIGDPVLQVRSALVSLGQQDSYWGSGWDAAGAAPPAENPYTAKLVVPQGGSGAAGTGAGPGPGAGGLKPQILPLDKPSGTRVSRILEGSMDAANMP